MRWLLLLALFWALLVPAGAQAWRAPTDQERGEIVVQLGGDPTSPCYEVSVSTVDESWASAWPIMPVPECEYLWRDEILFFHRTAAWEWEATNTDQHCPKGVPFPTGRDLRWGAVSACTKRWDAWRRCDAFTHGLGVGRIKIKRDDCDQARYLIRRWFDGLPGHHRVVRVRDMDDRQWRCRSKVVEGSVSPYMDIQCRAVKPRARLRFSLFS